MMSRWFFGRAAARRGAAQRVVASHVNTAEDAETPMK